MPISVLPREEGFGTLIGRGLGSTLGEQLKDFQDRKRNRSFALKLAEQLGQPNPEKFADTFQYVSPNDLPNVLTKQLEAQALYQDLFGQEKGQGFGLKETQDQNLMSQLKPVMPQQEPVAFEQEPQVVQNINQTQQPEIKAGYSEIPGVEDLLIPSKTLDKLLAPKKFTPPVGKYLSEKRKYQEERAKEERAELAKYTESFAPINELRNQAKNLERLGTVLAKYEPNKIQTALIAALDTGFTDSLRKILTTEDQDIIEGLIIPFVRTKDFGGSNPSTKEVLLKMKQYPSIYNSKAGNKILYGAMKSYVMSNLKKAEAAQAIRAINGDADPKLLKDALDKSIKNYETDFIDNDKTKYKIRQYDRRTKKFREGSVLGFKGLENALADKNFETEILD